jgi:MFS family permease
MNTNQLKTNIKKYYLFQAFNSLAFFSPVIVLFWQSKGLDMAQILTLQSIYAIGALLLELPTGGFADHFGKKMSLVFGALFFTLGLFWYGISSNFWQFVVGELTTALGISFISGADRAFIHQTLRSLGREQDFNKTEGKVRGLNQVFQALGNIGGGFIGAISLGLTITATGFSTLIAFLISLSFSKTNLELPREEKTNYFQTITESIQIIRSGSDVLWLTLFFAVINSLVFTNYWFSQPYFQMVKIPIVYFGVIFAIFSLISAFLSTLTHKLDILLKDKVFLVIGLVSILSTFLLGTFPNIYLTPLFAISTTIVVINQTLISAKTLALVPAERSATILSFQSLLRRLVYALIIPFLGILSDHFGIGAALQFNAFFLTILLVSLLLVRNNMQRVNI